MTTVKPGFVTAVIMLALTGCATLPARNEPLVRFSQAEGYRFDNIEDAQNSDSLFVILTFSGGGTGAAALAYGVLEKLADTDITWEGKTRRLLDEVDIISSVSGGSLTAAYYGLYGGRIFQNFADRVLYKDLQSGIIKHALHNLSRLRAPNFSRTDIMAEHFDERVFDYHTYGDLLDQNTRPFIVVNATNLSLGTRFEFIQDQFDFLYSDLAELPIGCAVAASAAFPGLLSPLTLRNYPKGEGYQEPTWIADALVSRRAHPARYDRAEAYRTYLDDVNHPYIHLIDGGVSDNLGLRGVIHALDSNDSPWSVRPKIDRNEIRKVVVITVNAKPRHATDWDTRPKTPRLAHVLERSSTTPMAHFTTGTIDLFKLKLNEWTEETRFRNRMQAFLANQAPNVGIPDAPPPTVDYYFIEVAFDWLEDPQRRRRFSEIPTTFKLPKEDVDDLRDVAAQLLDQDPTFNRLLQELR